MRSAGYAVVQQALVEVAAAAVWQAANLARRRGHAQVTPLHVASTMLSTGGLLRAACLRSSSHSKSPALRPEALQFCLDVALSRLPMVWPPAAAMFTNHGAPVMALSNALVAALKRAQAHERRGSADGGQRQPGGLVVKVGLEQLVVSILDDPSVDRALREAGFSGTQVKANVRKEASSEHSDSVHSHRSDNIAASPWPVSKKANAGQTSPGTVWDVLHRPVVVPDRSLALILSCHR
ncbi:hypothetical protein QYE76_002938 [Lolium multiflorum]|uniref:Clp R domain-containing protein n=1 Tax=Lolium multiflorum TaxID=4521 RepID=A0AAD8W0T4_LOLMU|nr:hypothetical protein QYE76_002938 [Lolium multiflorum]